MEWVNFKVKEGEREKLKNDAHAHRMNISEHLRWLNCYLARFVGVKHLLRLYRHTNTL